MAVQIRHHYGPPPPAIAKAEARLNDAREKAAQSIRTDRDLREVKVMLDHLAAPLVNAMAAGIWPPMPMMILTEGDALRVRAINPSEFYLSPAEQSGSEVGRPTFK